MEVKYNTVREDYWRYNLFVINRIPGLKIMRIVSFLIGPSVLLGEMLYFRADLITIIIAFLIAAPTSTLFVMWSGKYRYLKAIRNHPGQIGLNTLSISPEGLKQTSDLGESKVPWTNFTEITQSKTLLCFFLSPRYAVIVPKTAFPGDDAHTFLEYAQGCRNHALYGGPLPQEPRNNQWPPAPHPGA